MVAAVGVAVHVARGFRFGPLLEEDGFLCIQRAVLLFFSLCMVRYPDLMITPVFSIVKA